MKFRNITTFLLGIFVLYGVLFLLTSIVDMERFGILGMVVLQLLFLWAPGLSALYVHKIQNGGSLEELGMVRKYMDKKWYWGAVAFPYAAVAGTLGIIYLFGNVLQVPGFGEIITNIFSFVPESLIAGYDWLQVPGPLGMEYLPVLPLALPPMILNAILLFLVLGFVVGPSISMVFLLGEELAWRGFMVKETQSKGFVKSNVIIGSCWAASYLPLLLMGGNDPYIFLEFAVFLGFCISFTFPLTYLNFKANSVLASAALRGTFGIVGGICVFLIMGGSELIGSITGLAGILFFSIAGLLIYRFDRDFVENFADLRFERKWKEGHEPEAETPQEED